MKVWFVFLLAAAVSVIVLIGIARYGLFPYDELSYERSFNDMVFFHPPQRSESITRDKFEKIDKVLRSGGIGFFDGYSSGPNGIESISIMIDASEVTPDEVLQMLLKQELLPNGTTL